MRNRLQVALIGLALLAPAVAGAQIVTECWDFPYASIDLAVPSGQNAALLVVPDGSGPSFTQARGPAGEIIDATITFHLIDCENVPVASFPFEDMWLQAVDFGLVICNGGSVADVNTDASGSTRWTNPLRAGGTSAAGTEIIINGSPLPGLPTMPIHFNSPDLNGDRLVNLTDVPLFSADFYGPYAFRSDFLRDGAVNLSDVVLMAASLGASCP